MIIRTLDNIFVNLDNVTKIRFDHSDRYYPISVIYKTKLSRCHEDENDFDREYPLADFGIDSADLYKIRDKFIAALKKNEPYFDFREAYVQTCEDPETVLKDIEETYDK